MAKTKILEIRKKSSQLEEWFIGLDPPFSWRSVIAEFYRSLFPQPFANPGLLVFFFYKQSFHQPTLLYISENTGKWFLYIRLIIAVSGVLLGLAWFCFFKPMVIFKIKIILLCNFEAYAYVARNERIF